MNDSNRALPELGTHTTPVVVADYVYEAVRLRALIESGDVDWDTAADQLSSQFVGRGLTRHVIDDLLWYGKHYLAGHNRKTSPFLFRDPPPWLTPIDLS
ncbi:hypothetical protein ACWDUL_20905 [Nocardia niigatensis]